MRIAVDLPDTASLAHLDQEYLKETLVAMLYHLGKLSEKEACLALGMTRRAFEEKLPEFGFSILADDEDTIDTERGHYEIWHDEPIGSLPRGQIRRAVLQRLLH